MGTKRLHGGPGEWTIRRQFAPFSILKLPSRSYRKHPCSVSVRQPQNMTSGTQNGVLLNEHPCQQVRARSAAYERAPWKRRYALLNLAIYRVFGPEDDLCVFDQEKLCSLVLDLGCNLGADRNQRKTRIQAKTLAFG